MNTEDHMMDTHQKTVLQQISDMAWLVRNGGENLGILNRNIQDKYTFISGRNLISFNNIKEVGEHFGNTSLLQEQITTSIVRPDKIFIKGHAVDYPDPFVLEPGHPDYRDDVPLYSKISTSKAYYAAGFYCIHFEKGWLWANAPKLSTLLKYGFEGPFRTVMEVKQRMRKLNAK